MNRRERERETNLLLLFVELFDVGITLKELSKILLSFVCPRREMKERFQSIRNDTINETFTQNIEQTSSNDRREIIIDIRIHLFQINIRLEEERDQSHLDSTRRRHVVFWRKTRRNRIILLSRVNVSSSSSSSSSLKSKMSEPPSSWDQSSVDDLAAANQFASLNVNAMEFVPCFGPPSSSSSSSSSVTPKVLPKTPPSTPVIQRHENPPSMDDQQTMEEEFLDEDIAMTSKNEGTTLKSTTTTTTTLPIKEKKVVVKRDIIRKKEPVNIIFCGHVDAGKSTIGGQLM